MFQALFISHSMTFFSIYFVLKFSQLAALFSLHFVFKIPGAALLFGGQIFMPNYLTDNGLSSGQVRGPSLT